MDLFNFYNSLEHKNLRTCRFYAHYVHSKASMVPIAFCHVPATYQVKLALPDSRLYIFPARYCYKMEKCRVVSPFYIVIGVISL